MVYDTKKHLLISGKKGIKLSKLEHKLLICLSSTNIVTYEEILKYIYNFDMKRIHAIRNLINRFRIKTELDVRTVQGRGFILKSRIYYE